MFNKMIRIGIIEDNPYVLHGIEKFLNAQAEMEVLVATDSVEGFLKVLKGKRLELDVILSDINLPGGMTGIEGIKHIKEELPNVNILMISIFEDGDRIFDSIVAGAVGYLLKNTPLPEVKNAVETIYKGGSAMSPTIARKVLGHIQSPLKAKTVNKQSVLTDREKDIVDGIVEGLSYKLIASKYNISIETVRQHIKNIYRKLQVNNKVDVIKKSLRGEI